MQLEYSKLMPLASPFDLCSSAFEKTEKRQAGPIRSLKRDVWVFFPSLAFHSNGSKDSTCRELIEHFHYWTAQVITDSVKR